MTVRFFNDNNGPDGAPRTLIGVSYPVDNPGEAHEAVRVATKEDAEANPAEFQAFEKEQAEAAAKAKEAEQHRPAVEEAQHEGGGRAGQHAGQDERSRERRGH